MYLRKELKEYNKQLAEVASLSGVTSNMDFAIFQHHDYKRLYGGLGAKEMHAEKRAQKIPKDSGLYEQNRISDQFISCDSNRRKA